MRTGWRLIPFLLFVSFLQAQSISQGASGSEASSTFATLSAHAASARNSNRLDEAAGLYRQALALKPSWAEGWFSLGTLAYDQSAYRDAVSAFTRAVQLAPEQGDTQVMLGLSEFEVGQDDSALRHLQKGLRVGLPPESQLRKVALFHEAVLLKRAGKFDAAQGELYRLCAAGVESDELTRTLGLVALRVGRTDKEVPDSPAISQVGHAEWLAGQNKFDDARREYAAVVKTFPSLRNIHLAFGRFLLKEHAFADAIAEFEEEIKNQPGSVIARLQIAAVKYRVDSAGGLPYAQAAVKLNPASPFGHYLLGLLLLDTGDYKGALPELETAQKSLPQEPGVYYALGSAYARSGRAEDAARARATFKQLQNGESTSLSSAN